MNMLIHDMRNPIGSIEFGVSQCIESLDMWQVKIDMLKGVFQKYMDQEILEDNVNIDSSVYHMLNGNEVEEEEKQ